MLQNEEEHERALVFMVGKFTSVLVVKKMKGCCAKTFADLERRKRVMGEGAAVSRQERVE